MGAQRALLLAAEHPERVDGVVFIAPAVAVGPLTTGRATIRFDERLETHEGWGKYNRHYWVENYRDFLEFFFAQVYTEPHSTKQIEDAVGWGLETTGRRSSRRRAAGSARRRRGGSRRASGAPCSSCTGRTTRCGRTPPARRWPRRPAARSSRSRARGTRRTRATR